MNGRALGLVGVTEIPGELSPQSITLRLDTIDRELDIAIREQTEPLDRNSVGKHKENGREDKSR
jgi:hypothetical protein